MSNFLTIDQLIANCKKKGGNSLSEQHIGKIKSHICELFKEIYGIDEPIRIHKLVEEAPRFLFYIGSCITISAQYAYIRNIRTLLKYNHKPCEMYTRDIVTSVRRDIEKHDHTLKKEINRLETAKDANIRIMQTKIKQASRKFVVINKKYKDLEISNRELNKDLYVERQIVRKYKENEIPIKKLKEKIDKLEEKANTYKERYDKIQNVAKKALANISNTE